MLQMVEKSKPTKGLTCACQRVAHVHVKIQILAKPISQLTTREISAYEKKKKKLQKNGLCFACLKQYYYEPKIKFYTRETSDLRDGI